MIEVFSADIQDVKIIVLEKKPDPRGYFIQKYSREDFIQAGLQFDFLQDNESWNAKFGTLRGLHFQAPEFAQAKLVSVITGSIFDVAVDIRNGSPTYGKYVALTIRAEDHKQILIPHGFAHGFCTLESDTLVSYKVDASYSAPHEGGLLWNDPSLAINWPPQAKQPILSDKDRQWEAFDSFVSPFQYGSI
jgi:dTDP-4-dehydrorhamnose 3,5-epimerase